MPTIYSLYVFNFLSGGKPVGETTLQSTALSGMLSILARTSIGFRSVDYNNFKIAINDYIAALPVDYLLRRRLKY